ncbi:MAG: hypothetical protein CR965_02230 [Paludibacter sp.]|nr:MAG: hypothetical protein CR965_02230 [Paludibacter sp.]
MNTELKELKKQKNDTKTDSDLTLWTIQPIEWYENLLKDGIIYGTKELSDWYKDDDVEFRQAYD